MTDTTVGPMPRIALVGAPNSGKTALFNALTGSRQKVANYAGVTVEKKEGPATTPGGLRVQVLDDLAVQLKGDAAPAFRDGPAGHGFLWGSPTVGGAVPVPHQLRCSGHHITPRSMAKPSTARTMRSEIRPLACDGPIEDCLRLRPAHGNWGGSKRGGGGNYSLGSMAA
jgi:hypothetical protein